MKEKIKHYQFDTCSKCNEGTLEVVDMKGKEFLQCDQCDAIFK